MTRKELEKFLHRHDQSLSLIGALIVFFTFIVNDVLRERPKEMASSIASAQNFLLIRNDTRSLQYQHREMSRSLEAVEDEVYLHANPSKFLGPRPVHVIPLYEHMANPIPDAIESFDRLSQLIRSMPEDQATANELQSLRTEAKDLIKTRGSLLGAADRLEFGSDAVPPGKDYVPEDYVPDPKRVGEARAHWQEYEKQERGWLDRINKLARQILKGADETRDRAERNYKRFTYFSYFLYSVGWALALLGKLYRIEAG